MSHKCAILNNILTISCLCYFLVCALDHIKKSTNKWHYFFNNKLYIAIFLTIGNGIELCKFFNSFGEKQYKSWSCDNHSILTYILDKS